MVTLLDLQSFGESTGLSASWVLFAILLFGGLWGILGMLVGVPLFALIYQIISDIVNARLERRKMSTITDHYMDLKEIVAQEDGMVYVKVYRGMSYPAKQKAGE